MTDLKDFLIKLNENLQQEWSTTYGGSEDDVGFSVQQTSDGGYLICGITASYGPSRENLYVLRVDEARAPAPRDELMTRLQTAGVSTRPGTHAVHMLGLYRRRYGLAPEDYPRSRDCARDSLAIPLHNRMTASDFRYVVDSIRNLG